MSIELQRELGFLLDDFRGRVPKVAHIVALSSDGILVARDAGLEQETGEKLAATAAGLVSLLRTAGEQLRVGDCSHNVIDGSDPPTVARSTELPSRSLCDRTGADAEHAVSGAPADQRRRQRNQADPAPWRLRSHENESDQHHARTDAQAPIDDYDILAHNHFSPS